MKTNKTILLAIFSAVMLFACSKEEVIGPQGPQGEQGTQGEQGESGEDGNANVHSYEFEIGSGNWDWQPDNLRFRYNHTIPQLNSEDFGLGAVMVYYKLSTIWYAMPRYSNGRSWWHTHNTNSTNNLSLFAESDSWVSEPGSLYSGIMNVKVVVISEKSMHNAYDIDWADYSQVARRLNL